MVTLVDEDKKELKKVPKTSHDYLAVSGTLLNGCITTIVYRNGASPTGKNLYWEINGTKGSLLMEGSLGFPNISHPTLKFASTEEGSELQLIDVETPDGVAGNVGQAYEAFADCRDGDFPTFDNALIRHRMLEAIYESDRKGTRESYKSAY